jgi:hypothetical protein
MIIIYFKKRMRIILGLIQGKAMAMSPRSVGVMPSILAGMLAVHFKKGNALFWQLLLCAIKP